MRDVNNGAQTGQPDRSRRAKQGTAMKKAKPINRKRAGTIAGTCIGCGTLLLAGALWIAAPAAAEKLDLSTMTCEQFIHADEQTIMVTLAWLDAYYKTDDDPPVIDTDKFVKNAEKLAGFCAKSPSLGLITAADEVFD